MPTFWTQPRWWNDYNSTNITTSSSATGRAWWRRNARDTWTAITTPTLDWGSTCTSSATDWYVTNPHYMDVDDLQITELIEPEVIRAPIVLRRREPVIEPVRAPQLSDAQQRARELLLRNLSPEQRKTFEEHGWFVVEGSRQNYRIKTRVGISANIEVIEGDRITHRLCAHCAHGAMPTDDHFLAQKLMLEGAEQEFLRIANRHAL